MDMQFAAKEVSRFTSKPEEQDWSSAKRSARYLKDNNRVATEHKYQKLPEKLVVWSDADLCGLQANDAVNLRRCSHVRQALHRGAQPDPGDISAL